MSGSRIKLSGQEIGRLRDAIISAFPDKASLEMMVAIELDENLDEIAGGQTLKAIVFYLIKKWAEPKGKLKELVEGACKENPGNQDLKNIRKELFTHDNNKRIDITFGRNTNRSNQKLIVNYQGVQNQHFTEDLGNGVEIEMLYIPGGNFIMGAPENEQGSYDDERPQHQVTVPSFFIGKYPVTQAQWRAVTFLTKVSHELKPNPSHFKGDNRPVERVSWLDAVEFCDRLSGHTNKNYHLPSEAEWEYACRAGTTTPFHFGETITSELANYGGNYNQTTDVGSLGRANAFGLYDMHGNVWEWCADQWHSNYEEAPTDKSAWVIDNNDNDNHSRVLRGGSWHFSSEDCRCAYRNSYYPAFNDYAFGLRVVCGVLV
ncbi:SUMF1/EgtB/PvdO family nonheme iron enzyme [Mastigocoleus sp. MO_188.B34]|uniref:SUMF1/EgtB/PvdO family nonheme iron enzyme n=1 Tax=Mastigocoleus sp. MO_188.B34 TaxID=3036635 RepID=UPI003451627C